MVLLRLFVEREGEGIAVPASVRVVMDPVAEDDAATIVGEREIEQQVTVTIYIVVYLGVLRDQLFGVLHEPLVSLYIHLRIVPRS